jgi:hypothetical protein
MLWVSITASWRSTADRPKTRVAIFGSPDGRLP